MKRDLVPGDVLVRYLMPFSVWHYGIIIQVLGQSLDEILMLDFSDGAKVTRGTLRDFMYGRHYFWIDDFAGEQELYGPDEFYSHKERVQRAIAISERGGMTYTINKYNCEFFVRKCVFKNRDIWVSRQTLNDGETRFSVFSKLFLMFTYGIAKNHTDLSRMESRLNPTPYKYLVCLKCGQFHLCGNIDEYDYMNCCCGEKLKLH
jgi:hypothetical protein